jgi:hypothetical protein
MSNYFLIAARVHLTDFISENIIVVLRLIKFNNQVLLRVKKNPSIEEGCKCCF